VSGTVPSAPTGGAVCTSVALDSAAFAGIGSSGTAATVQAVVDTHGAFSTSNLELPDTVTIGGYNVTAKCASGATGTTATAPFATASFNVASVLPLDHKTHAKQQWLALVVVAVLAAIVLIALYTSGNAVFSGHDNRLSTSKTIAIMWTPVVAYMVTTLAFIAVAEDDFGLWHVLVGSPVGVYLVLLGGPFAGLVGAKAIVSTRTSGGSLQKPAATGGPRFIDLVSDDNGNLDVVDTQYLFFNLMAIGVVLAQFIYRPGFGAPDIPWFLAGLTSASAATYLTNKAVVSNAPSVSSVSPRQVRVGQAVRASGANLAPVGAGEAKPTVTVGGFSADPQYVVPHDSYVEFRIPAPATGQNYPVNIEQQVVITTVGNLVAVADNGVTVFTDNPNPQRHDPSVQLGAALSVSGTNMFSAIDETVDGMALPTASSPVTIKLAGGTPIACPRTDPPTPTDSDTQVTVVVPATAAANPAYTISLRGTDAPGALEVTA
jgi:hypothetical protein